MQMNPGFTISRERRPCIVSDKRKGLFHLWKVSKNGSIYALIELENGKVDLFPYTEIEFVDHSDFKERCFKNFSREDINKNDTYW